ncbi:MAG TPA: DEAD/DEAH box helicase family protein [Anaerolineae bacterium]|nr:DEAD/DEAH box helicase family protein [Anaerolineae bacterium]
MQKEAKARIKINKLLENAGWRLVDSSSGKANVSLEAHVIMQDLGDDFESITQGYVDYLLQDERGFPVCVLEAKSEEKDPLVGKEQARQYANSQNVRYIILSNGNIHYLWDKEWGNPTRVSRFPSLDTLKSHTEFSPDPQQILEEEVKSDYIVQTQNPNYQKDPRWQDETKQADFCKQYSFKFFRPYQLDAIHAVQKAVSEGKNRFLLEMATGTGKTLVAAGIIKLYLRTGNARRVLFLVDRLELENQAKRSFDRYLLPDYRTVIFKDNRGDWQSAEIVITTVQSISYENKYLRLFSPTDFDLIISDEAHRSISGNSRLIFEYFIGTKLGLTATPKDYLKNVKFDETDPREIEKRILLSTYKTFGCESAEPTFRYTLPDGVQDGYLINALAIDCRTEITTQLLSDEGYAIMVKHADEQDEEVIYKQRDFERKFFSKRTNQELCSTFLKNAICDPITNEIGKSIVFCVSQRHAAKIAQILNEMAHAIYPGKYNSDFAMQITSNVPGAQEMTMYFAYNNLSGNTRFLEGYKSSKSRVCVTVGMMTTGYDCEDILNLCLMRPIFSPTDFVQIKGRGTRKYTFEHTFRDDGRQERIYKKKEHYKLFDFFANCEYFEEKFPYDQVIELPARKKIAEGGPPYVTTPVKKEQVVIHIPDPLKTLKVLNFAGDVMRVDRELYISKFETKARDIYAEIPAFKEAVDSGDREGMEQTVRENLFNKPEEFFTLDTIRRGYQADRRLSLWEILDKVFGRISRFKTKSELADEEFDKFVVDTDIQPGLFYEVREFFRYYLTDEQFRLWINQKAFKNLASNPVMTEIMQALGKKKMEVISGYIKDNVYLNAFT